MSPRSSRAVTASRGVVASGIATFAASVGHAVGQGALPSTWVVVVAFLLSTPVCVALAGRRLSVWRLATAVVLSQVAFHLLLRLDFTGPSGSPSSSHGMVMSLAAGPAMPSHDMSPAMWAGHAVAAAATILALTLGEHAFLVLAALARRAFRALAPAPAGPVAPRLRAGVPTSVVHALVRGGEVRRRGPPVVAL